MMTEHNEPASKVERSPAFVATITSACFLGRVHVCFLFEQRFDRGHIAILARDVQSVEASRVAAIFVEAAAVESM